MHIEEQLLLRSLTDVIASLRYFRRLEHAWRVIEDSYSDPDLTLARAAKMSGIGKNHLNVLLRRTTGFTFHQLLTRYRLLKAIDLMTARNHSLLEITLATGFGSLNTFERNFRRLVGTTPREFRVHYTPPI